jgi:hypothetical protein
MNYGLTLNSLPAPTPTPAQIEEMRKRLAAMINPQIGDIQNLFQNQIHRNSPTVDSLTGGPFLDEVLKRGLTGGDNI